MTILKLRLRTADEFEELYQRNLASGGLFVPTTTALAEGEPVVIELSAPQLPNKVLIRGFVQAWRPALPRLRVRAGATVAFETDESSKRDFVRDALSGKRGTLSRRKHNRLPVSIPVRYRLAKTAALIDSTVQEISIGGAMLGTAEPLPLGADVIVELVPPGGAAPLAISGKVSYHVPNGATGVKFHTRDSDGSRRLRELIRRLRSTT